MKTNDFRGDLTDNSAKKEALVSRRDAERQIAASCSTLLPNVGNDLDQTQATIVDPTRSQECEFRTGC